MIERVSLVSNFRSQFQEVMANGGIERLLKVLREMDQKLGDVEYKFIERSAVLSDDKYFQQAYKVYSNLIWLNGAVGTGAGDEAGGADFRPTDTQVAVRLPVEDRAVRRVDHERRRAQQGDDQPVG